MVGRDRRAIEAAAGLPTAVAAGDDGPGHPKSAAEFPVMSLRIAGDAFVCFAKRNWLRERERERQREAADGGVSTSGDGENPEDGRPQAWHFCVKNPPRISSSSATDALVLGMPASGTKRGGLNPKLSKIRRILCLEIVLSSPCSHSRGEGWLDTQSLFATETSRTHGVLSRGPSLGGNVWGSSHHRSLDAPEDPRTTSRTPQARRHGEKSLHISGARIGPEIHLSRTKQGRCNTRRSDNHPSD
ncbi:hypothetical protein NL676_035827 [Syzygium grande]|nr:hypothetical protein NL676_035827 [Syzygium grande]